MNTQTQNYREGHQFVGQLRSAKEDKNGYVVIHLLESDGLYPQRFSFKSDHPLVEVLEQAEIGDILWVRLSAPRIAKSRQGKDYLSQFPLDLEVIEKAENASR